MLALELRYVAQLKIETKGFLLSYSVCITDTGNYSNEADKVSINGNVMDQIQIKYIINHDTVFLQIYVHFIGFVGIVSGVRYAN